VARSEKKFFKSVKAAAGCDIIIMMVEEGSSPNKGKRMTEKIRKGDIVVINEDKCFTMRNGGKRTFPLENGHEDDTRVVGAKYQCTPADTEAWRRAQREEIDAAVAAGEDTFHITCDSAGESRLPPRSGRVYLKAGVAYTVLRARCRAAFGYGNPTPGLVKLLDHESGREVFVKRELVRVA
jgi:hypothetical protein